MGTGPDVPVPTLPIFLSLLVLTIPILLILLVIQNAAALVFPAWASLGPERATGFEVLGQRLVWMLGTFVGASLMLAPPGLAGGRRQDAYDPLRQGWLRPLLRQVVTPSSPSSSTPAPDFG